MITQEQFNKVYYGLAAQGWIPSYDKDEVLCMYRGENGLKCAIGHLIDDDKYTPIMDDQIGSSGSWSCSDFHKNGMLENITFEEFSALQAAHDLASNPKGMKESFDNLAGYFGLKVPS